MELLAFAYSATAYEDAIAPDTSDPLEVLGWFPLTPSLLSGFLVTLTIASVLGVTQGSAMAALQPGDVGSAVEVLQTTLLSLNYYDGAVTGYYGTLTQRAVAEFQRDRGLVADGVAGDDTLQALTLSPDLDAASGGGGGGGAPTSLVPDFSNTPSESTVASPGSVVGDALEPALVKTPSNIGLNIRETPAGLRVGGEPDGATVLYRPASATFVQDATLGAYTWVQIADGNWMARDYLYGSATPTPNPPTAVYRVSATRGASIFDRPNGQMVGLIAPGQTVTLSQDDVFNGGAFWGELTGDRGWVAKDSLTLVAVGGGGSGGGSPNVFRVDASALIVRDAPSGSDTGHTLYAGQLVQTTGVTTLVAGRSWSQLLDGTWVASDYLKPA